jgi:hypothetical protein
MYTSTFSVPSSAWGRKYDQNFIPLSALLLAVPLELTFLGQENSIVSAAENVKYLQTSAQWHLGANISNLLLNTNNALHIVKPNTFSNDLKFSIFSQMSNKSADSC